MWDSPSRFSFPFAWFHAGPCRTQGCAGKQNCSFAPCCVFMFWSSVNSVGKTNPTIRESCGVHGRALPGPANLTVMLSTSSVRFRITSIARLNHISFLAGMWNGNSMALEYPGWNYNSCSLWVVSSLWLQKDFFEPEVNKATQLGQNNPVLFYMELCIFILLI